MPKYRLLTQDELKSMEKEFVDYLVLNSIVADEWQKIKSQTPDKANKIIELFSDVVFEKILRGVKYLLKQTPKELFAFYCEEKEIHLVGLVAPNDPNADFTNPAYIKAITLDPSGDFKIFKTDKPYAKQRELEIFEMLENGAAVDQSKLYDALITLA